MMQQPLVKPPRKMEYIVLVFQLGQVIEDHSLGESLDSG